MNIKAIEPRQFIEFVDERILQYHSCKDCDENENLAILHIEYSNIPGSTWVLSTIYKAKEFDVIEGDADHVGEILHSTIFSIKFCPFCGEILNS